MERNGSSIVVDGGRSTLKSIQEVSIHSPNRAWTAPASDRRVLRSGLVLGLLMAFFGVLMAGSSTKHAHAKMKKPISVYPLPKTPVASDTTSFSFRGIKKKNLGPIVVVGKRSGRHRGRLLAHSDGKGVSFIPKRSFKRGELVTVRTRRWIRGANNKKRKHGRFWVRIGRFFGSNKPGKPVPAKPVEGTLKSRPDLAPPKVQVNTITPAASMGKIFFAPKEEGMTIADREGRIVWFRPTGHGGNGTDIWNFRTHRYRNRPVLTYWKGHKIAMTGGRFSTQSSFEILNRRYKRIAKFEPANGYRPDFHGFEITPWNTALVLSYRGVVWDASKFGGSRKARIVDNIIQEVDVKTGAALFEWHSIGNTSVGSSLTKMPKGKAPFDYWHANSVYEDGKNAFLISARKFGTVYRVNRWNGKIMWALRGTPKPANRRSDFKMGPGTHFGYQHDAYRLPNGDISLFDNSAFPTNPNEEGAYPLAPGAPSLVNPESSGLVLRLRGKKKNRTATLVRRNAHPEHLVSKSQGNAHWQPGDGMFIGWGSNSQMTEYDRDGNVTFDATVPEIAKSSYRAFKDPWHGIAPGRPAIASEIAPAGEPEGLTVWVSWNGASDIRNWRVLTGTGETDLTEAKTVPWADLETEIQVPGPVAGKVQVEALDKDGKVLGRTALADAGNQVR